MPHTNINSGACVSGGQSKHRRQDVTLRSISEASSVIFFEGTALGIVSVYRTTRAAMYQFQLAVARCDEDQNR